MSDSWERYCTHDDIREVCGGVQVRFANERRQHVSIRDDGDAFRLVSVVARARVFKNEKVEFSGLDAWKRNRSCRLVGFRFDRRDRLIGESWVPKAGLTPDELAVYLRTLAAECDRLEFLLTGRDVE